MHALRTGEMAGQKPPSVDQTTIEGPTGTQEGAMAGSLPGYDLSANIVHAIMRWGATNYEGHGAQTELIRMYLLKFASRDSRFLPARKLK